MKLWQFAHISAHMHVYVLLMFAVFAAMVIIALCHHFNRKNRDDKHEDELEKLKGGADGPAPSAEPEEKTEKPAEAEKEAEE